MPDTIRTLLIRLYESTYEGTPTEAGLLDCAPFLRFVLPEDEWEQGEPHANR